MNILYLIIYILHQYKIIFLAQGNHDILLLFLCCKTILALMC